MAPSAAIAAITGQAGRPAGSHSAARSWPPRPAPHTPHPTPRWGWGGKREPGTPPPPLIVMPAPSPLPPQTLIYEGRDAGGQFVIGRAAFS